MKDIAVYTVILDDYDPLRVPLHPQVAEEADFYCFTNTAITSEYYTVVSIEKMSDNATLTNRYYKILSHPVLSEYKYTIYLDGSLQITTETLLPLINQVLDDSDIAVFNHRFRTCVYDEGKAIIYNRRANYKAVYSHLKRYSDEGYPEKYGLIEGGVIVRNNQSSRVKEFTKAWWQEFRENAHRDQLSFNYTVWKHPLAIAFIPGNIATNDFFKYYFRVNQRPIKTLYDKIVCRYWAIRVDLLTGKFTFGSYVL